MYRTNRRTLLLSAAAASLPVAGCHSEAVSDAVAEAVEDIPAERIEEGIVALRGFEIVAWEVGKRVVFLPHPAIRIIGVSLLVSAGVAKLLIEYLDVELVRQKHEEDLQNEEVVELESQQSVTFKLENGYTEDVPLGPKTYQ